MGYLRASDIVVMHAHEILQRAGRAQIKGVLREQSTIAGIGGFTLRPPTESFRMPPAASAESRTSSAEPSLKSRLPSPLRS